jgi:hypothetical protein
MNLRKKFLAACLMGTAIAGFSASAEAQITTTTNRLKLVNGTSSLTLLPPATGGAQTLQLPVLDPGSEIVVTAPASPQTITGGLTLTGALTLGTDLSVANGGTGASTFTQNGLLVGNAAGPITTTSNPTTGTTQFLTQQNVAGVPQPAVWTDGSGNFIVNGTTQQTASNFNIDGDGTIGGIATVTGAFNANGAVTLGDGLDVITLNGSGSANATINEDGLDIAAGAAVETFAFTNGAGDLNITTDGSVTAATGFVATTGGANITGGITNNAGGITGAGAISGATTFTSNGATTLGALNAVGVVHTDGTGLLSTSLIVDADVDANAAIAGAKIDPDFVAQAVSTTGTITGGAITGTSLTASTGDITASTGDLVATTGVVIARGEGSTFGPALAADGAYVTINGVPGTDVELQVNGDANITGSLTAGSLAMSGDLDMNEFDIIDLGDLTFANNGDPSVITKFGGQPLTIDATGGDLILDGDDATVASNTLTIDAATTFNSTAAHGTNQVSGSNFVVTGGSIDGTVIGATTPAAATVSTLSGSFTGRFDLGAQAPATSYTISNAAVVGATSTVTATFVDLSAPYESYIIVVSDVSDGSFKVELPDVPSADQYIMYTITN